MLCNELIEVILELILMLGIGLMFHAQIIVTETPKLTNISPSNIIKYKRH
jgi:hypothetical protein